jgi:ribosomal protein S12 methylthiotransferase accessory factor
MSDKAYWRGTHRSVSPEHTWEVVQPLLAEAGITRVANLTGLDRIGIPVFSVCRPNSRSISVAMGKGVTETAAKVSGVMEALEGFQAENMVAPLRLGSAAELRSQGLRVHVHGFARSAALPYDEHARILWIEARRHTDSLAVWIPYELVHTDYRLPLPSGSGRFLLSSNGLASGNHFHEAMSHGLCEVIERDATTLWSQMSAARMAERRLALGSITDETCGSLLEQLQAADLAIVVWDVTSDVGVPAFVCKLADRDGASFRPVGVRHGMGCHPHAGIALSRALTEAAQARLTVISGARDDLAMRHYDEESEERKRREFLRLAAEHASRNFTDVLSHASHSFASDLDFLAARLGSIGCRDIFTVDITRTRWPLAAVRVVVPGLEATHEAPAYIMGPRAARQQAEAS